MGINSYRATVKFLSPKIEDALLDENRPRGRDWAAVVLGHEEMKEPHKAPREQPAKAGKAPAAAGKPAPDAAGKPPHRKRGGDAHKAHRPARKPKTCFSCKKEGHVVADCPVRGGLVHEREPDLKKLEGKPVAEVLAALRPEEGNPNAGDDPRVDGKKRDREAKAPEEDPEAKKARKLKEVEANLRDKAVTLFFSKDLGSQADCKVVLQNLVQLARKETYYQLCPDADARLMNIFSDAHARAYDIRLKHAKSRVISRISNGSLLKWFESLSRGIKGLPFKYSTWDKKSLKEKPDLEILGFYEGTKPYSLFKVKHQRPVWYYFGILFRLVFSVLAEKLLYLILLFVVCNDYSPFMAGICYKQFYPTPDPFEGQSWFHIKTDAEERQYRAWNNANIAAKLQHDIEYSQCGMSLSRFAIFFSFVVLVAVEVYYLSRKQRRILDKIMDGALRIFFHALDAVVFAQFIPNVPIPYLSGAGLTVLILTARDLAYYLELIIICFHLCINSYFIFWLHAPERCFSIVEAVMHLEDTCLEDHPMKRVKTQEGYKSVAADVNCRLKKGIHMFWGIEGILPTVFANCSHNEVISMEGRVGKLLPAHESEAITKSIVKNWCKLIKSVARLFELVPESSQPMDFYEWACTFPPKRRDELIQVKTQCKDMPPLYAKSFIKREIAPKDEYDLSFKDPRFIQGCPLELSVAVGPHLRTWTKQVRDGIAPECYTTAEVLSGKHIFYTCGRSNEEIGECFRRCITLIEEMAGDDDVVFLEDDQSRFDLHLTEGPFRFLRKMYSNKLPRKQANLLRRAVSRGTSSLGTRYSIPYTMQSGWPDTSVGDTLVNAAMKTYIHGFGRPWVSIICGDDSVTVTTRREIERLGGVDGIVQSYAHLGMEVEAKISVDPLDVEFCSGRFYPCGDSYILFPKPGRIMSKIAADLKVRKPDDQKAWMRGISSTLRYYGRYDPLLGSLGVAFSRCLGEGREIYDAGWEYKHTFDRSMETDRHDVNMYYNHHYGLCAGQVDDLCSLLLQQEIGSMCCDSVLRHIAIHDIA